MRWGPEEWLLVSIAFATLIHPSLPDRAQSPSTVPTFYGVIRGVILTNPQLPNPVEAYLGVPYASSPAASLRFMPPLTPSHWEGVRMADQFGPVCPQILPDVSNRTRALNRMPLLKYTRMLEISRLLSNQSEDCLHLNIYRVKEEKLKVQLVPILVILQGESWEWGSGNLVDGSALASIGRLMVVTLNYRLGGLGFLQTSPQQGNFAIMDVVAALNWISQNGQSFGGDVNRVTILGHRTGAVLANLLMLAPVASELFHRVILLSGSASSPWSIQRHARTNALKLAQLFNCQQMAPNVLPFPGRPAAPTTHDHAPCLRDVPISKFLQTIQQIVHPRFLSRFAPIIDGTVVRPDFQNEMKVNSHFSKVELLLGTSTIESFSELNTEDIEDGLQDSKRDRILRTLVRNIFTYHLNEIFSTIKNEYTDWEKPRKDFIDARDSILNVLSDGLVVAPLVQVASVHASKGKTYFFHFQYEAEGSNYPQRLGSISEDLLEFSMGHPILQGNPSYAKGDARVSNSLIHYLTNFVVSGDPNAGYEATSVEEAQLTFWDSYDAVNQMYLEIGSGEPRMRSHYRGHKMALWVNLIPQLHQSGGSDVTMAHHNFREERVEFYEGPVRDQLPHPPTPDPILITRLRPPVRPKVPEPDEDYEDTTIPPLMSSSDCPPNITVKNMTQAPPTGAEEDMVRQLAASHYHSYGTALGVTIGVGCCLLLLNLLIFLAIYHQKTSNPHPPPVAPMKENHNCVHHVNHSTFYDDFEEEDLVRELHCDYSSGYSSPPIPEPPPPPRSIPPSIHGSTQSINSVKEFDYSSMKKRVQIQEISV